MGATHVEKECKVCHKVSRHYTWVRANKTVVESRCVRCESVRRKRWRHENIAASRVNSINSHSRQRGHAGLKISTEELQHFISNHSFMCDVCKCDISGTSDTGRILYRIDHSHTTGALRGMLCNRCNCLAGHFEKDPSLMGKLQEYMLSVAA